MFPSSKPKFPPKPDPKSLSPSTPLDLAPKPKLSARVASMAAYVEQLEADLSATQLLKDDHERRMRVAEGINVELKTELERMRKVYETEEAHLKNERDYYQQNYLELAAKLESAESIILDVLQRKRRQQTNSLTSPSGNYQTNSTVVPADKLQTNTTKVPVLTDEQLAATNSPEL